MRGWYVLALALLMFGSLVPFGMAASDLAQAGREPPDGSCASHALVPFSERESSSKGGVVAHFVNEGPAATGRICLFDGDGAKRVDLVVDFAAYEARDVEIRAPAGVYTYRSEFAYGGGSTWASGTVNTKWCLSQTEDLHRRFRAGPDGIGASAESGGCVPGPLAVGIVGLFGAGAAFALGKFPHLGALVLYSRIAKPRVLDQSVRARVFDLVEREPGIHAGQLLRSLETAEGQTAYHLGVLARERALVSVGLPGMKHWFVAGRFSPDQMRAIALLRDPTRRRIYESIVEGPGTTLRSLAARVGVSVAQCSRGVRALADAGLVERRPSGRELALWPARAPIDVYGSTDKRGPAATA